MPTLKLTEQVADSIASAVEQGVPFETAATAAGFSHDRVQEWLTAGRTGFWRHPHVRVSPASKAQLTAFAEKITGAVARWEQKQVQGINEAGQQYNANTGIREWRAAGWLLERHAETRQRWRIERASQNEHHVTIHPAHAIVRELSTQEVLELEQKMLDAPDE